MDNLDKKERCLASADYTLNFVWNKRTGMYNRLGVKGSGTGTVKQTARFVHTYWPMKCNGYRLVVGIFIS